MAISFQNLALVGPAIPGATALINSANGSSVAGAEGSAICIAGPLTLIAMLFSAGDTPEKSSKIESEAETVYTLTPTQLRCITNPYDNTFQCVMARNLMANMPFAQQLTENINRLRASVSAGGTTSTPSEPIDLPAYVTPENVTLQLWNNLLYHYPKWPLSMLNAVVSFQVAIGTRYALESASHTLARFFPSLFNATEFHQPTLLIDFRNAMLLGFVGRILFAGGSFFTNNASDHQLTTEKMPVWKIYATEFMMRGLIGVNALLGQRHPDEVVALKKAKDVLQSKTVAHFFPPLAVFGRVTPAKRGKLLGFGMDMVANTGLDILNALILPSQVPLSQRITAGIIISALVGYANTNITQHDGFNYSQKYVRRVGINIFKSGIYRGVCISSAVMPAVNILLQVAAGFAAIGYSDKATHQHKKHN